MWNVLQSNMCKCMGAPVLVAAIKIEYMFSIGWHRNRDFVSYLLERNSFFGCTAYTFPLHSQKCISNAHTQLNSWIHHESIQHNDSDFIAVATQSILTMARVNLWCISSGEKALLLRLRMYFDKVFYAVILLLLFHFILFRFFTLVSLCIVSSECKFVYFIFAFPEPTEWWKCNCICR